ncbi:MAG: DUF4105 domain-containing protein [Desulfobulbaceae bacterium]|nr:DUF4105 domain-containing protein [Desulfobulbaceae bacterium]
MYDRRSFIALFFALPLIAWGGGSLYYSPFSTPLPTIAAGGFVLVSLAVFFLARTWKQAVSRFAVLFAVVLVIFLFKEPSNERNWQPDLVLLPSATIEGDRITIHNIRNCDYRTETDFTVQHYDKTFDLKELTSIDLYLVDWGLTSVVHTMLSFGFNNRDYVAVSIEARKELGEGYSTIKGFFRQYELTYVVADERDLVRLRTNYRPGETAYLYRLQGNKKLFQEIFLDYLRSINRLKDKAEWYNALLTNCTTQLRGHTRPYYQKVVWDWRLLANGYADALAYETGTIDTSLPFTELKRQSIINPKAQAADQDHNFSLRIREGLPGMNPTAPPK